MKYYNQITFIDISTSSFNIIDTIDEVDISKFPIPHKGERLSIAKHNDNEKFCLYVVNSVEYAYKHLSGVLTDNIITFIKIFVKKI